MQKLCESHVATYSENDLDDIFRVLVPCARVSLGHYNGLLGL